MVRLWTKGRTGFVALFLFSFTGCAFGTAGTAAQAGSHYNGQLLSVKAVHALMPQTRVYRLYYWSRGYRVEAYLTQPVQRGIYPLLIALHGGPVWRENGPYPSGFTELQAASNASNSYMVLYPEYQGYGSSRGDVRGLRTDTANTLDALHAIEHLGHVNRHRLYLLGFSGGGGVALMVAGELAGVRAVVAISPYVGLRDVLPWFQQHASSGWTFSGQLANLEASYGAHPSESILSAESPDIPAITAPVLLLQGTADQHVAWQTVQKFYRQMKAAGKTVKLILFPGGHHGLKHTNVVPSVEASTQWFSRYGLTSYRE